MKIVYDLMEKDTPKKVSNYIRKLWKEDKIDELLLLIDIDKNFNCGLDRIPEFEDAVHSDTKYSFKDFFTLVEKLKQNISDEDKHKLIEESALECDEIDWNLIYRKALTHDLHSVINIPAIVETLKKLTKG